MSKSTSLSIGLFLLVYFCKVKNRSTKPFTAFYNARKNGKLPLHSYTIATRNRPLCYICAEVIIMCLRCFLTSKKSGPNVKEEPPLHLPHAGCAFDRSRALRSAAATAQIWRLPILQHNTHFQYIRLTFHSLISGSMFDMIYHQGLSPLCLFAVLIEHDQRGCDCCGQRDYQCCQVHQSRFSIPTTFQPLSMFISHYRKQPMPTHFSIGFYKICLYSNDKIEHFIMESKNLP